MAGRFITLPCVVTRDPKTGKRNVGMYRMQVYDERTTGMHWQRQKVAAEHYRELLRRAAAMPGPHGDLGCEQSSLTAALSCRQPSTSWPAPGGGSMLADGDRPSGKMEVAVAIGTDPALTFSAIVPAPPEVEEYHDRRIPAPEAGRTGEVRNRRSRSSRVTRKSFSKATSISTNSAPKAHSATTPASIRWKIDYPVFHVTCITHRKNPIYATTIVGKPPMEDAWMGKAVERIFLPLMQLTIPEIVDINLPVEGVFHNLMIVSIRKSYPGQARKVMNAIWSLGQAMFTKCIIVVDEDVNVQDIGEVTLKVFNHIDPERDIQFTLGPVDSLDHASRLPNYGSKMGIDATRKWPSEGFTRPWPDEILMDEKTKALVDKKWKELGIE